MELEHQKVNYESFIISLTVDHLGGINELDTFKGILKKLSTDSKKVGYKTKYTMLERELIDELALNILGEDKGEQNVSNLNGGLTEVADNM
jgi:hypothetical protein